MLTYAYEGGYNRWAGFSIGIIGMTSYLIPPHLLFRARL